VWAPGATTLNRKTGCSALAQVHSPTRATSREWASRVSLGWGPVRPHGADVDTKFQKQAARFPHRGLPLARRPPMNKGEHAYTSGTASLRPRAEARIQDLASEPQTRFEPTRCQARCEGGIGTSAATLPQVSGTAAAAAKCRTPSPWRITAAAAGAAADTKLPKTHHSERLQVGSLRHSAGQWCMPPCTSHRLPHLWTAAS
jgi:hypothetical protein